VAVIRFAIMFDYARVGRQTRGLGHDNLDEELLEAQLQILWGHTQ